MKFRTYLENIIDIQIYPLISLILFVVFFVLISFWAFGSSDSSINRMKNIPFDEEEGEGNLVPKK